ncbi:signal peptidase II [Streptomyces sp. NPDC059209]|uniref:signal peptidase II n=1 Tax=Streptomyces sp. NPDC059209 TaxID=3346769 RepID=UPI0036BB348D
MNSNDEPEAAKTVPATDAPGVRGGAAAPRGSANAADAATEAPSDPAASGGVGADGTIGTGPAEAAGAADTVGVSVGAGTSGTGGAPAGTTATTVEADRADTGTGTSAAGTADRNASDATNPAAPDTASTVAPTSTNSVATGTATPTAPAGTADTNTADTANAPAAAGPAAADPDDPGVGRTPDTTRAAPPTRRLFWSTLGVALVLLLVDQASKWWAVGALGDSESIDVVGDVIRFWLVYNPGAAFSMGTGVTWVFTIFAGVAVVAIAWYAWRVRSTPWAYALGLLLGGATSHFGDRLFREPGFARGHVVDFIDYAGFFVGNVADIGIFAGAVSIVVLSFKGIEAVDRDAGDTPAG